MLHSDQFPLRAPPAPSPVFWHTSILLDRALPWSGDSQCTAYVDGSTRPSVLDFICKWHPTESSTLYPGTWSRLHTELWPLPQLWLAPSARSALLYCKNWLLEPAKLFHLLTALMPQWMNLVASIDSVRTSTAAIGPRSGRCALTKCLREL